MELIALSRVSGWLLSERDHLIRDWGADAWRVAFEACGNPTDFDAYIGGDFVGSLDVVTHYQAELSVLSSASPV